MTVNTTSIISGPYTGNGTLDTYSYTFRVENKNQLKVFETTDLGVETELIVDSNYTVNNIGIDGGGTITRVAGNLPTDYIWYIRSNYIDTQDTAFSSQGSFFPEIHEAAFDKLTFLVQQLVDLNARNLSLSESTPLTVDTSLPLPTANKLLAWASDALSLVNADFIDNVFVVQESTPATDGSVYLWLKSSTGVFSFLDETGPAWVGITDTPGDGTVTLAKFGGDAAHLAYIGVENSSIASGATLDFNTVTGEFIHVTGTTTVTTISLAQGQERTVVFDGALILTDSASLILLKGGENITTKAGDVATFRGEGASITRCTSFERASGIPLIYGFTDSYVSGEIGITGAGNVTPSHGLSVDGVAVAPTLVQVRIVCKTAEFNYSIGDEVIINPTGMAQATSDGRGLSIVPTTTQLIIQYGSSSQPIEILNKTTGVTEFVTNANWKLVARAWV